MQASSGCFTTNSTKLLKFLDWILQRLISVAKMPLSQTITNTISNRSLGELNYRGTMGQITVKVIGIIVLRRSKALEWRMVKLDDRAE